MAGEAWRSLIPKEKTDSELRQDRWAAEAAPDYLLFLVLFGLALAVGFAIGIGFAK
jgi:hypothetical protein